MKMNYLAAAAACIMTSQAFVVSLYDDPNCEGAEASRNVYDDSCAYTGGFQSFKITTAGGTGTELVAYSQNACAGTQTAVRCGDSTSGCINTNGGSNAISAYG